MKYPRGKVKEVSDSFLFIKEQDPVSRFPSSSIPDHRPERVHQRQLMQKLWHSPRVTQLRQQQEMMNTRSCAQQSLCPIRAGEDIGYTVQRKASAGSTRFRQIAATMGAKYNVDTSGLHATHHSSFPGKLNAEATIQGNKIHFAPGMDTDYNIKHEVAHAIDNTLNGTPKGDQVVNGKNVDTSREKVVDSMAREPLKHEHSIPVFKNKNPGKSSVIQLKTGFEIELSVNLFRQPSANSPQIAKRVNGLTPQDYLDIEAFFFGCPEYGELVSDHSIKKSDVDWDIVIEDYNLQSREEFGRLLWIFYDEGYFTEDFDVLKYPMQKIEYRTRPFDEMNEDDGKSFGNTVNQIDTHAKNMVQSSSGGNSVEVNKGFLTGAPIAKLKKLARSRKAKKAVQELQKSMSKNKKNRGVSIQTNSGVLLSEVPALFKEEVDKYNYTTPQVVREHIFRLINGKSYFDNFLKDLENPTALEIDAVKGWLMLVLQYLHAELIFFSKVNTNHPKNSYIFLNKAPSMAATLKALPQRVRNYLDNDEVKEHWHHTLRLYAKDIHSDKSFLEELGAKHFNIHLKYVRGAQRFLKPRYDTWLRGILGLTTNEPTDEYESDESSKIELEDFPIQTDDDQKLIVLEHRYADTKYKSRGVDSLRNILTTEWQEATARRQKTIH